MTQPLIAPDVASKLLAEVIYERVLSFVDLDGLYEFEQQLWHAVAESGIAESEMRKQVEAQTPLGRIGRPQDIAGAAVFLASPDSSWITGETFVISGGNR